MIQRFRNLPLFWKVLVPFATLMVLVGAFGAFLIVRTLTARAQNSLEQDLSRRLLEARSVLRDRELSLLESATLAANLEGMASAIRRRDARSIARLGESVLALKTELRLLVITDRAGKGLVEFSREGETVNRIPERTWGGEPLVAQVLAESGPRKHADYLRSADSALLAVAAPVCSGSPCSLVGVAIVGDPLADAAAAARGTSPRPSASVALYGEDGTLLASAGPIAPERRAPTSFGESPVRQIREVGGESVATLYAPLHLQGRAAGQIGVSIPSEGAFASSRGAAFSLGLLVILSMAGVVGIGALISRLILAQVRSLVEVNRALGAGDLSARVPVLAADELGELALGVNKMAGELQASHETLEARVAERTEQVMALLQERTDFFAAISHELRTPLAVIIAQAELMRDPTIPKTSKWTAETGTAIGDSATQLLSLVNDILDLARAEAGLLVVSVTNLDLISVIAAIRPSIEELARRGEIEVALDLPERLPVRGDAFRLREIVLNLVDNAVKYTPPGGGIELAAIQRDDGVVEVSVSDTGIGIPSEVGDRVFEPFFRVAGTEPQRGQATSGLGLALARRLVEAQGGTISYTSYPAEGTRFLFTIPSPQKAFRTSPLRGRLRARTRA